RTLVDGDRAGGAREMPHEYAVRTTRAIPARRGIDVDRGAGSEIREPLIEHWCWRIERDLAAIEPDAAASALTRVERHSPKRDRTEFAMARGTLHSVVLSAPGSLLFPHPALPAR